MYETPELVVVGPVAGIVLGGPTDQSDSDSGELLPAIGIAMGLDE